MLYFRFQMWKFCLLAGFCLLIAPFWANAQQPAPLNDLELLALRVGASFDAQELDYFGLLPKNQPTLDSLHYGQVAGSFYIEPFSKGRSERILLNQATQAEFIKYVAFYERIALDPRELNISSLSNAGIGIRLPLRKYEKNGRTVLVTSLTGHTYFGEVMRVEGSKILLYDLDLGYDAQLVRTDVRLLNLDTIKEIKIYRLNIAKTTGLITGLVLGIGATAGGFSPYTFSNGNVQIAANLLTFPAAGFLIGLVLDEIFSFKTTYHLMPSPASYEKPLKIMSKRAMFPKQVPPELKRLLNGANQVLPKIKEEPIQNEFVNKTNPSFYYLPFEVVGKSKVVEGKINGVPLKFIFDIKPFI